MLGKVVSMKPAALQKKRENKNTVALDSEQNAIQVSSQNVSQPVWSIRNDLFRLLLFRAPDPTMLFKHIEIKIPYIQSKRYWYSTMHTVSIYLSIYLSALSFLPDSDTTQIFPDPDLGKSSGSDRIRLHITGRNSLVDQPRPRTVGLGPGSLID